MLEVKVWDSEKVTFAGPTGTLLLDRPSTFTGKVADFGAQGKHRSAGHPLRRPHDVGVLREQQQHRWDAGGLPTVPTSRSLRFWGNYMATSFVTAADGHGGTLITEAPNQLVPLTTPHTG